MGATRFLFPTSDIAPIRLIEMPNIMSRRAGLAMLALPSFAVALIAQGASANSAASMFVSQRHQIAPEFPPSTLLVADVDDDNDPTTFKSDGKCYRFQPNLGRTYEIKCPSDDTEDEPEETKPKPKPKSEPKPEPAVEEPAPRPAPSPEPVTPAPKAEPPAAEPETPPPAPPAPPLGPTTTAEIVLPEKGTRLRAELMNAARPSFEREIGGPIVFSTKRLAVYGDWAFGDVHPLRANGAEIDWSRTKFAEAQKGGMFEADTSFFLLKRVDGKWTLAEMVIGPTDVTWDSWRQQYNLPSTLFAN